LPTKYYDAGIGESGLKHWAKRPATRALKGSIEVFTSSTASRVHEGLVIGKAANCLGLSLPKKRNVHSVSSVSFGKGNITAGKVGKLVGKPKYTTQVERVNEKSDPIVTAEWLTSADSATLPSAIFDLFFEEYFQNLKADHHLPIIKVYTEYMLTSGELVRAHPNYGGNGALYDWVIIVDPANRFDYFQGTTIPRLVDEHDNLLLSRVETIYPDHVPARIVALFSDQNTGNDMAIVNACRPWSYKNYEYTSVITESWNLQVVQEWFWLTSEGTLISEPSSEEDQKVEQLSPMYHVIPANDIKQGLLAVQQIIRSRCSRA
jgi:hypothetical protein